MEPGIVLNPDTRVVPQVLVMLQSDSKMKRLGELQEPDLQTLIRIWCQELLKSWKLLTELKGLGY